MSRRPWRPLRFFDTRGGGAYLVIPFWLGVVLAPLFVVAEGLWALAGIVAYLVLLRALIALG